MASVTFLLFLLYPLFLKMYFALDNVMFAEMFSEDANLVNLGISLPAFISRTTLKLENILVTLKMVKKAITDL